MIFQIEFTWLVWLLLMFFGAVWAFGKVLLKQIEKRLDERFAAQETLRMESQKHWDTKFAAIDQARRDESGQWQRIERELLSLKADLPTQYVRREDYIRNQTIIEAKLDAVYSKLEVIQVKGNANA